MDKAFSGGCPATDRSVSKDLIGFPLASQMKPGECPSQGLFEFHHPEIVVV
jgi:hypothetical protein